MSRRARNIRNALRNSQRQKKKAAKRARFADAQKAQQNRRIEKVGKWRGMHRKPNRNRKRQPSCMTLRAFERYIGL